MTNVNQITGMLVMLGSVRAITSSAGALLECCDYTPFGRMLTASGTGRSAAGCYPSAPSVSGDNIDSGMSQKFTGQPHDDGTGLEYFGARFYSASLGRFTSPDPVLFTSRRMAQPHTLTRIFHRVSTAGAQSGALLRCACDVS